MIEIGKRVTWIDQRGKARDALVTAIHGEPGGRPSINIAVVAEDSKQWDSYGHKIQRESSVVHKDEQSAHGNYWIE